MIWMQLLHNILVYYQHVHGHYLIMPCGSPVPNIKYLYDLIKCLKNLLFESLAIQEFISCGQHANNNGGKDDVDIGKNKWNYTLKYNIKLWH